MQNEGVLWCHQSKPYYACVCAYIRKWYICVRQEAIYVTFGALSGVYFCLLQHSTENVVTVSFALAEQFHCMCWTIHRLMCKGRPLHKYGIMMRYAPGQKFV